MPRVFSYFRAERSADVIVMAECVYFEQSAICGLSAEASIFQCVYECVWECMRVVGVCECARYCVCVLWPVPAGYGKGGGGGGFEPTTITVAGRRLGNEPPQPP